ncbi:enoyl-CoA hydratase/isomerase family protein [Canibacter zhoujuaniae]|uniref:enoyl-CoA hydratase/isomerase family protein n=1 Tax=Canibacter zhoujuaniae TaxID=2708343 RepID=UPI0014222419|nr:enoyl-CoA hydratase-related protein [Canibacter zhoujuaniae]
MSAADFLKNAKFETLKTAVDELGIATIEINRPQALNALSALVVSDLHELLTELSSRAGLNGEQDWSVRGLILAGAGDKSFIAGADIAEMRDMNEMQALAYAGKAQEVTKLFGALPFPTVAAVDGWALGGGCEIAMCCDFIYATESAVFGQPEVGLGLIPGFGGTVRLHRFVGSAKAREMIFTGMRITAAEAQEAGLVTKLFADRDALFNGVHETLKLATKQSPTAIARAKATMAATESQSISEGLTTELSNFAACFGTPDMVEGTSAFVAKRKPQYPA